MGITKTTNLLIVYIAIFVMFAGNVLYATYSVRENGRKFCAIITTVNDAYATEEPKTELGIKLKNDYRQLERDLDCDRP